MSSDIFFCCCIFEANKNKRSEAINNNPESLKEWITNKQQKKNIYNNKEIS